jgi:FkbM family methyltransferase
LKVFLDVGAHVGETLKAVIDPRFQFDRIVCFEPAVSCLRHLARVKDSRMMVAPFGLWKETCERPLYDPGTVGASLFAEKRRSEAVEMARFARASDWFAENVDAHDIVFLKLNCEGAECDILEDLLDSAEIRKVDSILVHFDVRKIPSQRHRERQVKVRLQAAGIRNYAQAEDVLVGPSHVARVQHWLDSVGADEYRSLGPAERVQSTLRHLRFVTAPAFTQRTRLGSVARSVLPHRLHAQMQAFIYPEARKPR